MSELCITVIGRTAEDIRQARAAAEATADLVELRLDSMEMPDAAAALEGRRKPAIATCRPLREGGMFDGPEDARLRVLSEAHARGAEFIDLEWDALQAPVKAERAGRGVIVSRHVFDCTPSNAAAMFDHLRGQGCEVAKLAVMTERVSDLRTLLHAVRADRASVLIGMGSSGAATRVLAARYGSRWTYAGDGVAPGQMPASRLIDEFRFRRIRPDAAVYGLLGRPVSQSLSPAMHNAAFAALDMDWAYVVLPTAPELLGDAVRGLAALGFAGANVTTPHKLAVTEFCDTDAPSVNTLVVREGRVEGWTTDAAILDGLPRESPVVIGDGGVATAFLQALPSARRFARRGTWPPEVDGADLVVNATSERDAVLVELGPGQTLVDLPYPDTATAEAARRGGAHVVSGLEVLLAQGVAAFELWTGRQAPVEVMRKALGLPS